MESTLWINATTNGLYIPKRKGFTMSKRNKAFAEFKSGLTYKEIAAKNGVSESTVKSWAARYWNHDKSAARQRKKNKQKHTPNGRTSLLHNKNSEKHGGYSLVDINHLTEDELDMYINYPRDLETADMIKEEIVLSLIRLRRLLKTVKDINANLSGNDNIILKSSVINAGESESHTEYSLNPFLATIDIEHEITVIQNHMTSLLRLLAQVSRRENPDQWLIDFINQINNSNQTNEDKHG